MQTWQFFPTTIDKRAGYNAPNLKVLGIRNTLRDLPGSAGRAGFNDWWKSNLKLQVFFSCFGVESGTICSLMKQRCMMHEDESGNKDPIEIIRNSNFRDPGESGRNQ